MRSGNEWVEVEARPQTQRERRKSKRERSGSDTIVEGLEVNPESRACVTESGTQGCACGVMVQELQTPGRRLDKLGCVLGVAGLDYGKLRSVEARRGGRIFEWRCRLALIVFQSAKHAAA